MASLVSVSGTNAPGSPPPEVPEEFAAAYRAAYRAAYEQALAAQTDGAKHRDDLSNDEGIAVDAEDGVEDMSLPVRRGPIRVGTHRTEDEYDDTPTWFERIRDSHWFVPLLLVLLALLLIFSAYAVGKRFADQVEVDRRALRFPRIIVNGRR